MNAGTQPGCAPFLVVDLDGSLIRTDSLHEGALRVLKRNPFLALLFPFWLMRGKGYLKEQIAARATLEVETLPYNAAVLGVIERYAAGGSKVVLATAAHSSVAEAIARHLGKFDAVLATDLRRNLKGPRKLEEIRRHVGGQDFSYIGNDRPDLPIWKNCAEAYVVDPSPGVESGLSRLGKVPAQVMRTRKPYARSLARSLRPHQWLKNVLIFVPLVAAHRITDVATWQASILAFAAFCLVASSIYVVNDLLDLDADRAHPRKRNRPFAAGDLPISHGVVLAPVLLAGGIAIAFAINAVTGLVLLLYAASSTAYTFLLKRFVVVDALTLAGLYTLRILAGAAATGIVPSFWLLAFSIFFFLSLATMKRAAELQSLASSGGVASRGRDYLVRDLPAIRSLGVASGYISVMVLALYMNAPDISANYASPQALWVVCILLLYWLGRLWVKTDRGEMNDDPVVYAITDRNSQVLGLLCVASLAAATVRWA